MKNICVFLVTNQLCYTMSHAQIYWKVEVQGQGKDLDDI